jgi:hypothetical protein
VAASVVKKFGLSLARCASTRLEAPMATEPQALPVATSMRNMLAPSSRCADLMLPASSMTTTAMGLKLDLADWANAPAMMALACCRVSEVMRRSLCS